MHFYVRGGKVESGSPVDMRIPVPMDICKCFAGLKVEIEGGGWLPNTLVTGQNAEA